MRHLLGTVGAAATGSGQDAPAESRPEKRRRTEQDDASRKPASLPPPPPPPSDPDSSAAPAGSTDEQVAAALTKIAAHIGNPNKFAKASALLRQLLDGGALSRAAHRPLLFAALCAAFGDAQSPASAPAGAAAAAGAPARQDPSAACADPARRREYARLVASVQARAQELLGRAEREQLSVYALWAQLQARLFTDDSFAFNKAVGELKAAVAQLPPAGEAEEEGLERVLAPGVAGVGTAAAAAASRSGGRGAAGAAATAATEAAAAVAAEAAAAVAAGSSSAGGPGCAGPRGSGGGGVAGSAGDQGVGAVSVVAVAPPPGDAQLQGVAAVEADPFGLDSLLQQQGGGGAAAAAGGAHAGKQGRGHAADDAGGAGDEADPFCLDALLQQDTDGGGGGAAGSGGGGMDGGADGSGGGAGGSSGRGGGGGGGGGHGGGGGRGCGAWSAPECAAMRAQALMDCIVTAKTSRHKLAWARTSVELLIEHAHAHRAGFCAPQRKTLDGLLLFVRQSRAARSAGVGARPTGGEPTAFERARAEWGQAAVSVRGKVGASGEASKTLNWLG